MALLMPMMLSAREATVTSPNGKLQVEINDHDGRATYAVTLEGNRMVQPSTLGLKTDFADFTQGLTITSTKTTQVDKSYTMRQVKQSQMHFFTECGM